MQTENVIRRAKRVTEHVVKTRVSRSQKILMVYELKKKVTDALKRCGFDVKDGYLPYAKQFELLFVSIEPDLNARRKRLRRIISGTPRIDDSYWVEVLSRYSQEVHDVSRHYCSAGFEKGKLKL